MIKYAAFLGVLALGLTLAAVAWGATPIITAAGKTVISVAVSPDGKYIAVSSTDGTAGSGKVQIFNAKDGSLVHNLTWPNGSITYIFNLTFSADGTILYGREAFVVLAWNVATGTLVGEFAKNAGTNSTEGVAVNQSGATGSGNTAVLATEGKPGWLYIWDANNKVIATILVTRPADMNNTSPIDDIAFAPNGAFIVTVGQGSYACITEKKYQNGQWTWTCSLKNAIKLPAKGLKVDVSPYGKIVITVWQKSVIVVDKNTGKQITLKDSQGFTNCVFLSDGHTVACVSSSGAIGFWDGDTGAQKGTPQDSGSLSSSLAAGPNNTVYVGGTDGKVRLFQYGSPTPTATPTTTTSPSPSSSPNPTPTMSPTPTPTPKP